MGETMGKRIVQNRKGLGLTQDALAERLGVTAQAVSKWENDQSCPDITMLPKLAEIFGTTTDALLGLEPPAREAELMTEEVPGLHIDKKDGHWEFQWDSGRKGHIGIALWVLTIGGTLLAANLLKLHADLWTVVWSSALAVFGLFGLFPKFRFFRLGCALAGVYFLGEELWPKIFNLESSYILPIFLLFFGLSLLMDAGRKGKKPAFSVTSHVNGKQRQHYHTRGERFACSVSFGERCQLVELPRLSGGTAEVSFGELTLDLRGCGSIAEGCTLDLDCSFGELTLLVPAHVRVVPTSDTAFAEFSVSGQSAPDAAAVIYVNCDASFGAITLRYV